MRRSTKAHLGDGVARDAVVDWHKGFRIGNNLGPEVKEHRIDTSAKSWHPQAGMLLSLTSANLYDFFAKRPCTLMRGRAVACQRPNLWRATPSSDQKDSTIGMAVRSSVTGRRPSPPDGHSQAGGLTFMMSGHRSINADNSSAPC